MWSDETIKSIEFKRKFIYINGTFKYKGKLKKWEYKIPKDSVIDCNIKAIADPIEEIGMATEIKRKTTSTFTLKWRTIIGLCKKIGNYL